MATRSSVLAWRIPWTEEPGRLPSIGLQKSDTTEATEYTCMKRTEMAITLPWSVIETSRDFPDGPVVSTLYFHC